MLTTIPLLSALLSCSIALASPLSARENWGKEEHGSESNYDQCTCDTGSDTGSGDGLVDGRSLSELARKSNKYFGTAYQSFYLSDPRFEPILNAQFDQYTHENELKWEVVQPERGVFNWTGADLIFDQAAKTGAIIRGHTLVWHSQLPQWVQNITDKNELLEVMETHINAVLGRYGDRLAHIDAVNEPILDDGTWRDSVFYNLLGEDFVGIALDYARAAAPNVKLYVNDYNIETIGNKSLAHLALAKSLLDQGKPLDGYGFQCHFIGGSVPDDFAETLNLFSDLGLEVALTELDVRVPVNNRGLTNSTWLDIQAQDYANVVQLCLNNDLCPGVTIWGFGDETSWVPGVFPGEGAAGIYDFDYQPKPAYYAIADTLSQ